MPRSNSFCAAGLHDVSKCTLPSCFSLAAACAGWAAQINVSAAKAFVVFLIMISSQCRVSLVLGAEFFALLREKVLLCALHQRCACARSESTLTFRGSR